MKTIILLLGVGFFMLAAANVPAQKKKKLTLDAIFGGELYEPAPMEVCWLPDGRRLSYFLPEAGDDRSLWVLDIATGKKTQILSPLQAQEMAPSPEQASISERERTRRNRYEIRSYSWSPDGRQILLTSAGQLHLYTLDSGTAILLAPSKSNLLDAKFSPDGKWVSFICNHDIWVVAASGGEEKQLTFGGSELLLHGQLDWIYEEEFAVHAGYHWSPDSRRIAFLELDETAVPAYPIVQQIHLQANVDFQRYPKAGDPNPKARAGVVDLENARTVWSDRDAEYIPRFQWADARSFVLQLLNRAQNELELVEYDPETGRSRRLMTERDPHWLDIRNDLNFLSGGREFLWTSDRTGFRHLYLYDRMGNLLRQLTSGEWVVHGVEGVDEKNGWIYYSSNQASVLGRDLYRVSKDGSKSERVTDSTGTHDVKMNSQATAAVDLFSSVTRMQEIRVCDLASGKKSELFQPHVLDAFETVAPEMKLLQSPDGAPVRVLLYKPPDLAAGRKYTVVVYSYGMPGAPTIQDAWLGNRGLFHQFLAQQGFVVALIDDRTSAIPGHKYAVAGFRGIGPVAAKDHEFAVQYLKSLSFVNPDSIGIWGWSGGGFTAAYHMTHTNLFKAGVAGAPVTDWRLYDSIYTERYMRTPVEAPEDYDRVSCIAAAGDYRGRLLLIYGTQDDNVHPQNTIQLINALIKYKKQFDLMIYPGKTHGITGASENIHLYTMILEFFKRNLE